MNPAEGFEEFPIGVSTATAAALGLSRHRVRARTTTAYLLVGSRCGGGCAFCAMTAASPKNPCGEGGTARLSRVAWPMKKASEVMGALKTHASGFERVCLQVVRGMEGRAAELIHGIRSCSGLPVSVSCGPRDLASASAIMQAGADFIGISLDAATPEAYAELKGGDFRQRLDLITAAGRKWPGRVTTHLIVGLGETERQICGVIAELCSCKVVVALFAFTPIPGTPMARVPAPDMAAYRRIQIFHALSREGILEGAPDFDQIGRLTNLKVPDAGRPRMREVLAGAFMTSGCPGCNRPFYNERAGDTPFNFPHPPTDDDLSTAVAVSGLGGLC